MMLEAKKRSAVYNVFIKEWSVNPLDYFLVVVRNNQVCLFISSGPNDPNHSARIKQITENLNQRCPAWYFASLAEFPQRIFVSIYSPVHSRDDNIAIFLSRMTGLSVSESAESEHFE